MQNELFEKVPIPKAYMKMALPVVMGLDGVIAAQFASDIFTTCVAFGLFRANLWKEVF